VRIAAAAGRFLAAAATTSSSTPSSEPDAGAVDLVACLAAGDDAALREVYRRHHEAVRVFANRLVNDLAAAADLVHEVFVALPRAARRFRHEVPLRQFLIGMAINHARHHVRAAARRRRAQQRLAHQPAPQVTTPDRIAEHKQLGRALVAALDELPLDQRVAFVLCEVEERSSADAARIAGTTDGNMRARLLHARRALRRALAVWNDEGGNA
jgi:RNA polymerase sigma-70 factor (ECF subfamily)